MKHPALLLTIAVTLSACGTDGHRHPPGPVPTHIHTPLPAPSGPETVAPAVAMCEVGTLAEQRQSMLAEIHDYREAIQARGGRSGHVADTETQELVLAFETDLDASYRFATATCRTYNRCLEVHRFADGSCRDSARLWHEGQDRFHDLSLQMAAVRERIATGCSSCSRPAAPAGDRPYSHRDETPPADDLLGSVFSTGEHR